MLAAPRRLLPAGGGLAGPRGRARDRERDVGVPLRVLRAPDERLAHHGLGQPLVHGLVEAREPTGVGRAFEEAQVGQGDDAAEVGHRTPRGVGGTGTARVHVTTDVPGAPKEVGWVARAGARLAILLDPLVAAT